MMTKEKALEKIEIIYKLNGDFEHATKYIAGLYGLTPDFWKENFDFIIKDLIIKYYDANYCINKGEIFYKVFNEDIKKSCDTIINIIK